MSFLQQAAGPWLAWILAASWQLTAFIVIVAMIDWAARGFSPRLRYALWLLVLVKVFLPPGLTAPWSLGRWVIPLLGSMSISPSLPLHLTPTIWLVAWGAGCVVFLGVVGWRYAWLARTIRSAPAIDEGPLRIALERLAADLGLAQAPELYSTPLVTSPFLFGVVQPSIVLPEKSISELSQDELEAVLAHELVHHKHRDTWIGWLQVLAQGLFWFHPLVWWSNGQLRRQRESVCDEAVLRQCSLTPQQYGESIVRVLTASRGRSLVAGSLVGVFERGTTLQERLENIMSFEPREREFGWLSRFLVATTAALLLPMAPGRLQSAPAADTPYPQIVKTDPAVGAKGVDPALTEITVTFDRDMNQKGMSWTGGGPEFPKIDDTRKPEWKDARTCVLPVKLEQGAYYRLGINSTSHLNFRSADGVAVPPSAIYFTMKGAAADVEGKLRVPQIVSLEPANGAKDVDPKTDAIRVTFDMPMGEGMSWVGKRPDFPSLAEGKKVSWSADGRTCTLPVTLESGHEYKLGLNNLGNINFQSRAGVPLVPVVYTFRTSQGQR